MKRDKRRYLLIETSIEIRNEKIFEQTLYKCMIDIIGQIYYYKVNPKIIEIVDRKHFIIRVGLLGLDEAILCFSMIKRMNEEKTGFYTLKSSGTLKALRSKITEFV